LVADDGADDGPQAERIDKLALVEGDSSLRTDGACRRVDEVREIGGTRGRGGRGCACDDIGGTVVEGSWPSGGGNKNLWPQAQITALPTRRFSRL